MKLVRSVKVVVIDNSKQDPKNYLEPTRLGWLIRMLVYPIQVVLHDYCYLGLCRLFSSRYKEHLYWLNMQNSHLDGLHSEGPGPDCEYCAGLAQDVANGGYYRPWFESGWKPS
jgi:hypothetical protein